MRSQFLLPLAMIGGFLAAPVPGFAAGSSSDSPPRPTNTTRVCEDGMVYSTRLQTCVRVQSEMLDDETLYEAVREFAYAKQYNEALEALGAMSDQADDRVLTYRGFISRKTGDAELGNAYYRQAIAANPDNLLARSYMGQGFVAAGEMRAARQQLIEIRTRGGKGTWAETSLVAALATGTTFNY